MGSEWQTHESAALLLAIGVLVAIAWFVPGVTRFLAALLAILVFGLWVVGASGQLGLSAFR